MMICPKCGRSMTFSMTYFVGNPVVIWRCICGYDSSQERVFATSQTETSDSNFLQVTNQSKCY